ncbi:MAG: M20/M25/M40 family metallo-hydrolase [Acidobacteriota bacterium]|nr:M20/M25/M40 family metallo-hydrolase [Acidobacteriota bacterium]
MIQVIPVRTVIGVCAFAAAFTTASSAQDWLEAYRGPASALIRESQSTEAGWTRLAELTDTFGPRLSGSTNLERAITWAAAEMKKDGFDVRTEPVMVPVWIRGEERLDMVKPAVQPMALLGLGGSVGTPDAGVEAPVLVVQSFDDLKAKAAQARGRIVLFNVPYTTYGATVVYRSTGASEAAKLGAVASLVRAVGPVGLRTPHTGALNYAADAPRIPAAAIPVEDADRLQRLQNRGVETVLRLRMQARTAADAPSFNVVGEIRGRELPDEVILLGGHFDSWDVGTGASDDAVGCIVTWEALRLIKKMGLQPRRTIRVVLWTNEENGLRGGNAYAEAHAAAASSHVLALESDSGVFEPASIGMTGSDASRAVMTRVMSLLEPLGLQKLGPAGGGADIGPIVQAGQVPAMSYSGDSTKYFTIHHTPADTVDRIAKAEISKAAAAIAVIAYVTADMPVRLPR